MKTMIRPATMKPSLKIRRRGYSRRTYFTVATIFVVGWTTIYDQSRLRRLLGEVTEEDIASDRPSTFIDEEGVCVNALLYGKMHDLNLKEIKRYQDKLTENSGVVDDSSYDQDPPPYVVLPPGSSVARWDCVDSKKKCVNPQTNAMNFVKGSAWTADGDEAFPDEPHGLFKSVQDDHTRIWVPHNEYEFLATNRTVIKGDAAAFFGFYPTNFGHCLHDNFPLLAWLKSIAPDHATFILPDTTMYRKLIDFIDPTFTERIFFFLRQTK
jgi:hypothetical protein